MEGWLVHPPDTMDEILDDPSARYSDLPRDYGVQWCCSGGASSQSLGILLGTSVPRQGCHSSRPCSGLPNHAFRDKSWLARPAAKHRLLCKNNTQECDDGIAGTVLWVEGNVKSMVGNATHVTAGFSRASRRACIRRHRMAVSRPGTQCRRASRFKGSLLSKGRRLAPLGYGGLFPSPARRVHGIQALACWRGA